MIDNVSSDAGEADYFASLLNLERKANEKAAPPAPLLELAYLLQRCLEDEGVSAQPAKPNVVSRASIETICADPKLVVFERKAEGLHQAVVLDDASVICLSGLLLGSRNNSIGRAPSAIERQIVTDFFLAEKLAFSLVADPQISLPWQNFIAAKLALNEITDGPALVILANRREEMEQKVQPSNTNLHQQNQLKRAISKGIIKLDCVLDAGPMALETLRRLQPGSVLPLADLGALQVVARVNDTPVFGGAMTMSPGHMRIGITKDLQEVRHV